MNNQRGNVLVFIILAMSALIVLGSTYLYLAHQAKMGSTLYSREMQAYYTAEAGIKLAANMLQQDIRWNGTDNPIPFADGVIKQIEVKKNNNHYTVTSVAEHKGVTKTLIADFLFISSMLQFDKGIYIYGEDSGIKIGNKAVINSDVYLAGNADIKKHADIYGTIYTDVGSSIDLTLNDITNFKKLPGVQIVPPSSTLRMEDLSGIYYVDGSVVLEGDYSEDATIIATGDIICNSSITQDNPEAALCLISGNNIILDKKSNPHDEEFMLLAFALNEVIVVPNGGKMSGAIVARSLDSKNKFTFTYDQSMLDAMPEFIFSVRERYPAI